MVRVGQSPGDDGVDMDSPGGVKDPLPISDRTLWLKHEQEAYMQTMRLKR